MQASQSLSYNATDGAAYEVFLGRWTARLAEAMLDAVPIADSGALLDVGCGTGSLALAMTRRWPNREVVGVDIAPPYISYAQVREGSGQLVFDVADACKLPYPDATYAASAAQLVLNFVSDPEKALREMRRVTRPGGTVIASVWDFRGGLVYQRLFWDTVVSLDPAAERVRDRLFAAPLALPDGLPKLFSRSGFAGATQASITVRMDYADFDDYWQPLCGGQGPVGTYVAGVTGDLRARAEKAVKRAYCSGAPDGPRSLTATAWVAWGRA